MDLLNIIKRIKARFARPSAPASAVEPKSALFTAYAESVRPEYEETLKSLVDIESVSVDPDRAGEIERLAQAACRLLRSIGAEAEIIRTKGNPIVFGQILTSPANETVLIYNHLDVQPADSEEWLTEPFRMTIEDGVYKGRGTTDDKGPAMTALFAARYAAEHKLAVNIKFVWELEEEIGSPSFHEFVLANADKLKADSIVIADTIWVSRERPAIPYGLRGLQGLLFRLTTGAKDVHSGTTGGVARNPIGELCKLINECYDATSGRVKVPGFYDSAVPLSQDERENLARAGFDLSRFVSAHELHSVRTDDDHDAHLRICGLPTFEVHGITGGYSGAGIKTVVPHVAEAKISMRLVPNQDPDRIAELVTRFVRDKNPDVEVVKLDGLMPYLGEYTGPYYQAASKAMMRAFGKQPAYTREGGSIGAALSMNAGLHAPIVFLGLSLPEHGYHAVNENFDWQQAGGGIEMFIHYFTLLSEMK